MEYSESYLAMRQQRIKTLLQRTRLSARDAREFVELEDRMNSGDTGEDWLRSYHLSNDDYMRLFQKVLEAAVQLGEPHAKVKLQAFIEEKGTMGPAVFLTPWDVTLAYLDREYGAFSDVADFYGVADASAVSRSA